MNFFKTVTAAVSQASKAAAGKCNEEEEDLNQPTNPFPDLPPFADRFWHIDKHANLSTPSLFPPFVQRAPRRPMPR